MSERDAAVLNLLTREANLSGYMSIPEIAATLRYTTAQTRTVVNRLVRQGQIEPGGTNYSNARCYGIKTN